METLMPCVEYVESHLSKVSSDSLSESEMLNLLGGDGGFQVDAVLYLVQRSKFLKFHSERQPRMISVVADSCFQASAQPTSSISSG
jgi:hypothetical protein